nr:hypothetical protein [Tanacetum cinerariifolium]
MNLVLKELSQVVVPGAKKPWEILLLKLESSGDEESLGKDASKQERRIDAINADKDITLVNDTEKEMFDVDNLGGEEEKKRRGEELEQEITKKQKVEDDKEKAELKQLMETILNEEEVAIDAISLAVKSPRIVD